MKFNKSLTGEYWVCFFCVAFCLILPLKIGTKFQANEVHLQLVRILNPSDNSWLNLIVSDTLVSDDAEPFSKLLDSNGQNQYKNLLTTECYANYEVECDDLSNALYALALWHFARGREVLGNLFMMLNHVYRHNDAVAVPELVSVGAQGVLLSVGGVFNDHSDAQRATLYLEAAFMLNPTDYPIIRQLSILYLGQERYCDLVSVSSIGVDIYDSSLFYYYLGRGYEGLLEWGKASKAYEEALVRFPDYEPYKAFLQISRERARAQEMPTSGALEQCD